MSVASSCPLGRESEAPRSRFHKPPRAATGSGAGGQRSVIAPPSVGGRTVFTHRTTHHLEAGCVLALAHSSDDPPSSRRGASSLSLTHSSADDPPSGGGVRPGTLSGTLSGVPFRGEWRARERRPESETDREDTDPRVRLLVCTSSVHVALHTVRSVRRLCTAYTRSLDHSIYKHHCTIHLLATAYWLLPSK